MVERAAKSYTQSSNLVPEYQGRVREKLGFASGRVRAVGFLTPSKAWATHTNGLAHKPRRVCGKDTKSPPTPVFP